MERQDIWELRVTPADKKNVYCQLFTHRPTADDVLYTATVRPVREMVKCFGMPKGDGPMVCRMAGTYVGEIKVIQIPLFENGKNHDND